jgi:hypothetical protein
MNKKIVFFLVIFITGILLWQFGCKGNRIPPTGEIIYDIRGEWTINRVFGGVRSSKILCTFSGTKTNGTVTPESGRAGTYKVGGETGIQVEFFFYSHEYQPDEEETYEHYRGKFIDENYMEGTGSFFAWGAVRGNNPSNDSN